MNTLIKWLLLIFILPTPELSWANNLVWSQFEFTGTFSSELASQSYFQSVGRAWNSLAEYTGQLEQEGPPFPIIVDAEIQWVNFNGSVDLNENFDGSSTLKMAASNQLDVPADPYNSASVINAVYGGIDFFTVPSSRDYHFYGKINLETSMQLGADFSAYSEVQFYSYISIWEGNVARGIGEPFGAASVTLRSNESGPTGELVYQNDFESIIHLEPGNTYSWHIYGGTYGNVEYIPEPATMLLLGSGLIGFAVFRKKYLGIRSLKKGGRNDKNNNCTN